MKSTSVAYIEKEKAFKRFAFVEGKLNSVFLTRVFKYFHDQG